MKNLILLFVLLILSVSERTFAQIPPSYQWAQSVGLEGQGNAIAVDNEKNVYVSGLFEGSRIIGGVAVPAFGDEDIFLAKIDSTSKVCWVKSFGGPSQDVGISMVSDSDGHLYLSGSFNKTASFGNYNITSNGNEDVFLAKIDLDGNVIWVKNFGAKGYDSGNYINIGKDGNLYLTGYFEETVNFGSHTLTSNGGEDCFIARLDMDGNVIWAQSGGGSDYDTGSAVDADMDGNCYVTGWFNEYAVFGTTTIAGAGGADLFLAKYNQQGDLIWVKSAGGPDEDICFGLSVDSSGNFYWGGSYYEAAWFDNIQLKGNGFHDIFIVKGDSDGKFLWARTAGSAGPDYGFTLQQDKASSCYLIGTFTGQAAFGSESFSSNGDSDIFVSKLSPEGKFIWTKTGGGNGEENGYRLVLDKDADCYLTGSFEDTAQWDNLKTSTQEYYSIFVVKVYSGTKTSDISDFEFPDIKICPNPASNLLWVETDRPLKQAALRDVTGRLVLSQQANAKDISLDISSLMNGVYLLELTGLDNIKKVAKVVKK